jgi:thioredoxin 2
MGILAFDDRGLVVTCASCGQKNRLAFDRLADPQRCGKCKEDIPPISEPVEVTSAGDFDRLVTRASIPVVVDYWAPWCGPCHMVAPELATVAARKAGHWLIVKVNTDALTDLSEQAGIRSIPTMSVYAEGREVSRTTGARPASEIEAFVNYATRDLQKKERQT